MLKKRTQAGVLLAAIASSIIWPVNVPMAEPAPQPARGKAVAAAPLTLDTFNRLLKAGQKLAQMHGSDVSLDMSMAINGTQDAFESWHRRLESDSEAAAAIQDAGLTPAGYVRALVSVYQAAAVAGAKRAGKTVPETLMDQVPAANVTFVENHAREVDQLAARTAKGTVNPSTMEDVYVAEERPAESTKEEKAPQVVAKDAKIKDSKTKSNP